MASRPDQAELNAMARRVIDANHYMTLATQDADGRPRLSPLYYTCARYSDFYWSPPPLRTIPATSDHVRTWRS